MNFDESNSTKLLVCKTKYKLVKSESFPKMDFYAVRLAAKLKKECLRASSKTPSILSNKSACSDSVPLISGAARFWNTFELNRASYIIEIVPPSKLKHVPTEFNPASSVS